MSLIMLSPDEFLKCRDRLATHIEGLMQDTPDAVERLAEDLLKSGLIDMNQLVSEAYRVE